MKLFILVDDLSDGGPVWLNPIPAMLKVFSECLDVTVLQVPPRRRRDLPAPFGWLADRPGMRSCRRDWVARVRGALDPDGPNLLMVWATDPRNMRWSRALDPLWDRFSHRILHVLDTMQPEHVPQEAVQRFDLLTCFCQDLGERFAARTGRPMLFLPAHVDTLRFHNGSAYRPVDLIVVGRRDNRFHLPLYTHFNAPDRNRIFVDFVSRGQTPLTREQEFELLMAACGKAAAAFCYEPGRVARFCGTSPLLERWVHAWTSGCTVFGTRPTGGGTAALMDWPDSTIELPPEPDDAIALVETMLSDRDGMARRRHRNRLEAVRRHDTRLRIDQLLRRLGLAAPENLHRGLERLDALAASLEAGPR